MTHKMARVSFKKGSQYNWRVPLKIIASKECSTSAEEINCWWNFCELIRVTGFQSATWKWYHIPLCRLQFQLQCIIESESRQELREQSTSEKKINVWIFICLLSSCFLLSVQDPLCLGDGDTLSGLGLPISINNQDNIYRHVHRPTWSSMQFLKREKQRKIVLELEVILSLEVINRSHKQQPEDYRKLTRSQDLVETYLGSGTN